MGSATPTLETANVVIAGRESWMDQLVEILEGSRGANVLRVSSVDAVREQVKEEHPDGIVTGYNLPDGDGLEVLETIRGETVATPVVFCTDSGNESIASAAIRAGADDYISLSTEGTQNFEDVADRIAFAVREGQRERTRRDRAHQFEAIFQDSQTATWVLDAEGRLIRANQEAREMVDVDIRSVTGDPFWTVPWWTSTETIREDIHTVVRRTLDGEATDRLLTQPEAGDTEWLELSFLPVRNPRGELVSVVVEGTDVTERVSLYRELRESEKLHRVTLNNMTDTVLMTDESGEFTYICPNVDFIFGYSVQEIREMGTIDELLGEDLFDREELAEKGVLTNIETRATDKVGNEHVLLVNVREVDIQDGSLLFSCRDITKRKQREEALTTLQETTRNIQYAESKEEVAQILVQDATEVLDVPATGIFLYRTDDNTLSPAASSDRMEELHGPLSAVSANEDSLLGYSFVKNYPRYYDDIHEAERLATPATGLRSAAVVPIGDHGIFVAGTPDPGGFDRIRRELADLVVATAEAALDRVERDDQLRSQDRKLQRQNRQLKQLNELNELIREIDRSLVGAETREEIDQTVCEALTNSSHFTFAWIGEMDRSAERVEPNAWAGEGQSYLDSIEPTPSPTGTEPSGRTAASGDVTVVSNVAEGLRSEDWQKQAVRHGFQSVISVPLVYDEFSYGVLTVYGDNPDTFDDRIQDTLAELGETIASAISALNRKNALLTSGGTRLEFETRDPSFILLQVAQRTGCSMSFEGGVQQTDEGVSLVVSIEGDSIEEFIAGAREMVSVSSVEILSEGDADGLVRLHISQPFIAQSLADHGAILRRVVAREDSAELVIDVPTSTDSQPIIQHVLDSLDETELVAKYTEDKTPTRELYSTFLSRVTERQLEVLKAAYYGGFFESPREQSGEEIAESLDISGPAFYEHTRTVQRKLFETLFDEIGVPTAYSGENRE
jgi:PAS domain S-box-containing protein